jgi:hypothetical protein
VLWSTTIQREVPEEALSRVCSFEWFGPRTLALLGLLAGPAADATGTGHALAGWSFLIGLATAAALLAPRLGSRTGDLA